MRQEDGAGVYSLEDSANHIMAIFTVQRLTYEKTKLKV